MDFGKGSTDLLTISSEINFTHLTTTLANSLPYENIVIDWKYNYANRQKL